MVFIQHDLGLEVYKGKFYLLLTIMSDGFGFLFLVGIALATHRRKKEQPDKLHRTPGDDFMLSILALLIVQGFLLEALRIHSTIDPWEKYSFVGFTLSQIFWGLSRNAASLLHFAIWWFHTITVFVFIALIPYTKFFHIISSSLNLFFTELERPKGKLLPIGDLEKIMEDAMTSSDEEFNLGIGKLADLEWKRRLDLDACTSCGRCQEVCPAYNSGKVLSPKFLILDTRDHMLASAKELDISKLLPPIIAKSKVFNFLVKLDRMLLEKFLLFKSPSLGQGTYHRANSEAVQNSVKSGIGVLDSLLAGAVMDENVFWSCTTCRACQEVCPVNIEHVDYIVETRRNLLLIQGKAPSETQSLFRSLESQGTALGVQSEREDWTKGLNINFMKEGDSVEILYWVGCISAFDTRKQQIAKSLVKILNKSGKSWGMLGNLEKCSGDPARRLGDENTFQTLAKQNVVTFKSVNFETIVTHCPHCFNTIKNEYPEFGAISELPFNVLHHSVLIKDFIEKDIIKVSDNLDSKITFHDPCYLGRYNDVYEEPREVLVQLGLSRLTEMKESKEKSKCCGAGGGHYWFDMKAGDRVNVQRVEQALETGADTIASACPFCMQMLEDGIKLKNEETNLKVKDIAELVSENLI